MLRAGTSKPSRRTVLKGVGMATVGGSLGASLPVGGAAQAQGAPPAPKGPKLLEMDGKAKLAVLGDRPLVAETQAELLDDNVTPTNKLFIRNNGQIPEPPANADAWTLTVDGEVDKALKLTLGDLKQLFRPVTLKLQMECGGNGRSAFSPEARGNQWGNGAISNAEWTGVRLSHVLELVGARPQARYVVFMPFENSNNGNSRVLWSSIDMAEAHHPQTMLAYGMNGEDLPAGHGAPVRLRLARQLGYKNTKYLYRITLTDDMKAANDPARRGPWYGGI